MRRRRSYVYKVNPAPSDSSGGVKLSKTKVRAVQQTRIVVSSTDMLVVAGYEVAADILAEIINPKARLLWAFEKSDDGTRIMPVCYDETKVLWLTDKDIERKDGSD